MEKNRTTFSGPTPGELYALERNARRERAEAMGRLLVEGTRKLAAGFGRAASAVADALRGGMRHA